MADNKSLSSYLFTVEIDGIETARFQKCEGLEAETYVYEIEEGGLNTTTHKFYGRTRYPNLILEKGISDNDELFRWYRETLLEDRKIERKNGSVILKDSENREIKRWNFFRAFPCRWIGPRLETNLGSEYAVERIEIAHEGLEVDNDLAEVRNGIATPVGENFSDLKVSSPWGYRESFSTSKGDTLPGHNGMDFVAEKGTRVNAVMDGIITYVDSKGDGGYGKVVVIKHETGAQTLYGHLDRVLIDTRQFVQAGEQIGTVGSTGKSTGPHLHLGYDGNNDGEFSREDIQDNPASILYGGEW